VSSLTGQQRPRQLGGGWVSWRFHRHQTESQQGQQHQLRATLMAVVKKRVTKKVGKLMMEKIAVKSAAWFGLWINASNEVR
jgi:hypothetical protein